MLALRKSPLFVSLFTVVLPLVTACAGEAPATPTPTWPQWRGPDADSRSSEKAVPLTWTASEGVSWTQPLPEWGTSTPAICGEAIFLTSHEGNDLLVLRLDRQTGKEVWRRKVGEGTAPRMELRGKSREERRRQFFHRDHNLASPSPITDGERVVVHFGNGDLASYTLDGELEWKRNLQEDHGTYTIWWGHANSPVFHGDLVISVCMQDSLGDFQEELSPSYVVAHDKRTGKQVWKTMRMTGAESEPCDAYTTPVFRPTRKRLEMLVVGGTWLDAYDPQTGDRLWHLPGLGGNRTITGPTLTGDRMYMTVGMRGPLLAIDLPSGGEGEQSRDDLVAWEHREGTPDTPCPVVENDLVFIVSDNGIARCLEAKSGKVAWTERLGGRYRASPLAAPGRVYFLSTDGVCTVVDAASEFRKLAENRLDDTFFASPAVADGHVYLRGRKALYCIGPAF